MEITELLQRVRAGDREALKAVIPLVYTKLKKLASAHLRREGKPEPLQTTALVHEAFLKLARARPPAYENRSLFYKHEHQPPLSTFQLTSGHILVR